MKYFACINMFLLYFLYAKNEFQTQRKEPFIKLRKNHLFQLENIDAGKKTSLFYSQSDLTLLFAVCLELKS